MCAQRVKSVRYSYHSLSQMAERGVAREEVEEAILRGEKVPAKKGRLSFRLNFQYGQLWGGKWYHIKQVLPIVKEEDDFFMVITVYAFYF